MDVAGVTKVLSGIAAAGLDPARWPEVLRLLSETGHVKTNFVGWDQSRAATQVFMTEGHDPSFITTFAEHYADKNPWTGEFFHHAVGTPISADGLYPYADLCRTEFHADWLVPQGNLSMGGGVMFLNEPGRTLILGGVGERRLQDRYEQDWLDLISMVSPALKQACDMNRLLAHLSLRDMLQERADDGTAGALMVVMTLTRSIVLANAAAEREMARGTLLRLDLTRRLAFANPQDMTSVDQQMRRAVMGLAGTDSFSIHDVAGKPSHECRIAPFISGESAFSPAGPAPLDRRGLLVFNARPIRRSNEVGRKLRQRFGLSTAEVAIAIALADGLDTTAIAALRGASIHTVRNQVKSVLAKTDAHRQADLMRLIEGLRRDS